MVTYTCLYERPPTKILGTQAGECPWLWAHCTPHHMSFLGELNTSCVTPLGRDTLKPAFGFLQTTPHGLLVILPFIITVINPNYEHSNFWALWILVAQWDRPEDPWHKLSKVNLLNSTLHRLSLSLLCPPSFSKLTVTDRMTTQFIRQTGAWRVKGSS